MVGYSFGGSIALELASRLEMENLKGRLVLIDASPAFLEKLAMEQIASGDDDLEVIYLNGIVEFLLPEERLETMKKIMVHSKFEEKVEAIVDHMKNISNYSSAYASNMIKAVYKRIKIVLNVDLETLPIIVSPIALIRPAQVSFTNIANDYEMKQRTAGEFILKFVEGTHISMLENENLTQLVNSFESI